jgi:hypothetical protein
MGISGEFPGLGEFARMLPVFSPVSGAYVRNHVLTL